MTSLPIFLRPAVKFVEIDLTQRIQVILSTIGAVVGEFERGPIEPTYITGNMEYFTTRYGRVANPKLSFAHDTVTAFGTESTNCLVKRVTNAATYSGASVFFDADRKRILTQPFPVGSPDPYDVRGASVITLLSFIGDLVTANSFTMDVTDGSTVTAVGPVVFSTNNNQTLTNIAAAIQVTINSFSTKADGTATVHVETSSSNAQNRLIIIRQPSDASLTFLSPSVTLGASQTDVSVKDTAELFDVYAENPGKWSKLQYGFRLTNFDPGTRERFILTTTEAFVANNTFNVSVNGVPITPVPYNTSSDQTLEDIANALASLDSIASATVVSIPGASNNDRSIQIIAQRPGPDKLVFTAPTITGGSSQGIVTITRTLTGIDVDNTFDLEVFSRANVNVPVEQFRVSLRRQLSGLGAQQNIDYVVNQAANKAINIRVAQVLGTDAPSFSLYDPITGEIATPPTGITWLDGGDDGVAATSADIRRGWDTIKDRITYPFNVMLNAGYTSVSVHQHMTQLAEKRSDSIAILDMPSDKQDLAGARAYRLEDINIDSSYAALYTPDVLIEDINTGEQRYIPPSGPVGATYARSDRLTQAMGAPAGLNRGHVRLALGLRFKYEEGDQELMMPIGINFIIDRKGNGPVVMSEETLQNKQSILRNVHARRILNFIKTGLTDGLEYSLFDPNNQATRIRAVQLGETILRPYKDGGGLYDYRIKCDADNNTPDVIDNDVLAYDVYLKIVRIIKGVYVRGILTRTGISFQEVIDEMNLTAA